MSLIKTLKDKDGNILYPQTSIDAIFSNDGTTLTQELNERIPEKMSDLINDAEFLTRSTITKNDIELSNVENKSSATIRSEITNENITTALGFTPAEDEHTHTVSEITDLSKSSVGLGNVENKSSATIRGEITSSNVTTALGYTPLNSNLKGANSGLAELDSNGKVPTSQLPSYVDDVLEYNAKASFPTAGEAGKIYVDLATNKTYRWSGSAYTEISPSLALGETSATAYRGDRGKTAYDHSQVKDGSNPHATTFANITSKPTTLSGYGITDAKIASGTITLGSNSITPLTSSSSLNAAKLTGTASVNTTGNAATADIADSLATVEIPENADLDTYQTAGRYLQFTIATAKTFKNNPLSSVDTGVVLDVIKPDSTSTFQILYGIKTGGIYKRRAQSGTWVDWVRMATYDEVAPKTHTHNYAGSSSAGGAATSAAKLSTARNINGMSVDGSANRFNYGSCSTAAATAAKTVACTGFALATGSEITVKFTVTNTASSPTLNVNSTGAKPIYYRGSAISAGYLAANRTYTFRYNGTQYDLVGDVDTNSTNYLPLSGGTLSGNLNFSAASSINWTQGTIRQRISIGDDDTKTNNTFSLQESADSGSTFTDLMSVTGEGKVKATSFEVAKKVDIKYNATTQCLDFIFV